MKCKIIYECEICGAVSTDIDLIKYCEAKHLGLNNVKLYEEYKTLKEAARHAGAKIFLTKNFETYAKFEKACEAVTEFENKHKINKGVIINGI